MRKPRTLLILGALFIFLLILVLLQGQRLTTSGTPDVELLRVFPDMVVLEIQAIQIQSGTRDRTLLLTRAQEGEWTAPDLAGVLDSGTASDIARTIALLAYQRTLPLAAEDDLRVYGLAPTPVMLISVLMVNGTQHGVLVGTLNPTGSAYYALVDDRAELYPIERGQIDYLVNYLLNPPVDLTTLTPRSTLVNTGTNPSP